MSSIAIPAPRYYAAVQQAGEARAALNSYSAIADAMLRIKTDPTDAELIGLRSAVELLEFRVGAARMQAQSQATDGGLAGMVDWADFEAREGGA